MKKKKEAFLLLVLFLRLVIGGLMSMGVEKGRVVRVEGEVNKVYQKGSKCLVGVERFRVEIEGSCEFSRRDRVELSGKTEQGVIDWFLGRIWLKEGAKVELLKETENEKRGSRGVGVVLEGWRENLASVAVRLLPQKEAGLTAGIVLGEKMRLGRDFYEQLVETGTVHVVVASGYNVMVVGEMVMEAGVWVAKRTVMVWLAVGTMLVYALMAGGEAPVMRAVIMGMILLVGKAWGRQSKSGRGLFLAVWLMVMLRPEILEEVSFQLSVAASWGLIWVEPRLRGWLEGLGWGEGWKHLLRSELLPTVAAQITTTPIIWYYFGRVSWISPLVNVLVLPLVPLLMAGGGLMLFLGKLWLPLGRLVAWWVYAVSWLMVKIIELW